MMMDRDNITRTGARAPGVKRQIAARTEVLKRIVSPDTERGRDAKAGSTKGGGKPGDGKFSRRRGRPYLIFRP